MRRIRIKAAYYILVIIFITSSFGCSRVNPEDLFKAVANKNFAEVKKTIESGADVNATDRASLTPLMLASFYGDKPIVGYLIDKGANVNFQDQNGLTALHIAAQKGHLEIVKLLIERGAGEDIVDKQGWPPVLKAIQHKQLKVVDYLISNKEKANSKYAGVTPLYIAVVKRDPEIVMLLLKKGADPTLPSEIGETPIELANNEGYSEISSLFDDYKN